MKSFNREERDGKAASSTGRGDRRGSFLSIVHTLSARLLSAAGRRARGCRQSDGRGLPGVYVCVSQEDVENNRAQNDGVVYPHFFAPEQSPSHVAGMTRISDCRA